VTTALAPAQAGRWFRIAWLLTSGLPSRRASGLRSELLRRAGATIGDRVTIGPGVKILGPSRLTIGDRAGVARDACLDARAGLTIGSEALIGFESVVLSWTHRFDGEGAIGDQGMEGKPVSIGARSWLGARAFVMPGITIGDEAIVGSMAVVTRDVDPGSVVAGNPARVLRQR
jgi:acetyltransferase-like isoleucine patch superfamily enzyme